MKEFGRDKYWNKAENVKIALKLELQILYETQIEIRKNTLTSKITGDWY